MGLFDFFRKKPRLSKEKNELMDKVAEMLFGSLDQMRDQIKELSGLLGNRYNLGQVANALTWMTSNFNHEGDKSSFALVDDGQMKPS